MAKQDKEAQRKDAEFRSEMLNKLDDLHVVAEDDYVGPDGKMRPHESPGEVREAYDHELDDVAERRFGGA